MVYLIQFAYRIIKSMKGTVLNIKINLGESIAFLSTKYKTVL